MFEQLTRRVQHALPALALIVCTAFSAFSSAPSAAQNSGKVLRIGYQKSGLLAIIKAQRTLDQQLAPLGYTVKWFEFPAGPQLLEALNANSIDIGSTGAPPAVFAQAAGVRFVYIGTEPAGITNEAVIVKPDAPLHTVADLKGKRIALQKGSSSNYLLLALLQKAGLRYTDIQPVYLPPADARAAFENGTVDAWAIWDPYYAAAQQALHARTLADYTSLEAGHNFYEATRDFAQQHPDIVGIVLTQLRSTGEWVNAHPSETVDLIAPQVGLDRKVVDKWVRRVPYGTQAVTDDIVRSQQSVADTFYGAHLIPQRINVKDDVWQNPSVTAKLTATASTNSRKPGP